MYNENRIGVIIAAAGNGSRMEIKTPKQFIKIQGKTILEKAYNTFADCEIIDSIFVVSGSDHIERCKGIISGLSEDRKAKLGAVIVGGKDRQDSVFRALKFIEENEMEIPYVLIHDGARPFVDIETIERVAMETMESRAAVPYVKPKDTIRTKTKTLNRDELMSVQTPQGFEFKMILEAYEKADKENFRGTDDASLLEKIGVLPTMVEGTYNNIKVTTKEDLSMENRIGQGYDVHRLVEGRDCIIGGVNIPNEKGLMGHSDADVLIHAIMDAILGGAAMGDIGRHFPDSDDEYKGVSSLKLLKKVGQLINEKGFSIGNIDGTVICEKPKIAPYVDEIIQNIATALEIECNQVNIKGTTTEKLGFTGRGEGIASEAICILKTN